VLPLVTAKRVILVGVFHRYRVFNLRDRLVFDTYRAWRSPDGEIAISPLREELISKLSAEDYLRDAAMHDSEHSLEAVAYWLKHARADVEIVPIIVPAASFSRFEELASRLGQALAQTMKREGWALGKDVSIVISSDGTHYGRDFDYTPYGEGGVSAYVKATARDREILKGPLAGRVSAEKAEKFFAACVDPKNPDQYRMPWCGRFSIPFGLLFLNETAKGLGLKAVKGWPLAFGTSVGGPTLGKDFGTKELGIGETAPSNLYHFVSFPAEAYTVSH
jgi:predicted class III extradiol MEMO1 family dioxygenase